MTGQLTSLHTQKNSQSLLSLQTHTFKRRNSQLNWLPVPHSVERSYQRFPVLYENQKGKKEVSGQEWSWAVMLWWELYTSRLSDGSRRPRGYVHFPCNCRFLLPSGAADYDYTPDTTTSDVSCSRVKRFPSQQITRSHRRLSLLNMSVLI